MQPGDLRAVAVLSRRERTRIAMLRRGRMDEADKVAALRDAVVVTTWDLIAMKERAAADPATRRSKALRDAADAALLRGDVPDPDEGW
jgi:hypothetical protein